MVLEIISRMEIPVLELALTDAFCDMCIYNGEEFIQVLEQYIDDFEAGKSTEEHDKEFFEIAEPFLNHSILAYASYLVEGASEITVPADKANAENKSQVAADALSQTKDDAREKLQKVKGFSVPKNAKKLTEAEENDILEGIGQIIPNAAKEGIKKAKDYIVKTGGKLANATTSGIASAQKKLQNYLIGTKIGGNVATASPEKK